MLNPGELIEAIHGDRLTRVDDAQAQRVCRAIGDRVGLEVGEAIAHLDTAGIAATPVGDPTASQQRHAAAINLSDSTAAMTAAESLAEIGYSPWEPIMGPGWAIQRRFRSELTLAKTTDLTVALTLRWPRSGPAANLPAALVPNANDFDLLPMPSALWPLYFLVRPSRLVAERLGLRPRSGRALGPFLSTPDSLIGPLLKLADIGPDDVVVDLGCGDGRIVIAAAEHYGCRGIGLESNETLARQAQTAAARSPAANRLEIMAADAITAVTSAGATTTREQTVMDGTIFFVFVPADASSQLVHQLLEAVKPGATIIAHEQHRLPDRPEGADSVPVLTDQGVTVAHRWRAC